MESFSRQKWEDLNLSRDELKNIGDALQKEEFRNLLLDYVKEINDPENRKQYELEITQLENERGIDIKFVHPTPGYVIKTSVNGKNKAFINICCNENVGKPTSTPGTAGGHHGLQWSIPYCLAPPRDDVDKKNSLCSVFDVVFHPDTLHMTINNDGFKKLVNETALGAVEETYTVALDKINLKFPKMMFKGAKHPTVIRKKIKNFPTSDFIDIPNYPYSPPQEEVPSKGPIKKNSEHNLNEINKKEKYATPKYTVTHRNNVDMQDFTNDRNSKVSITVPTDLVFVIDLPLLKRSTDVTIDVTVKSLYLVSESPAKYQLNINFPYTVDSNKGNAKFDTVKKTLTVTLPVVKPSYFTGEAVRDDSGVESDNCNATSSVSSSDEDIRPTENEMSSRNNKSNDAMKYNLSKQMESTASEHSFLKSNVSYILPDFHCQLLKNCLAFTLQVSNVNPQTVEYCFYDRSYYTGLHLSFLSVGSGFFPLNYAFFTKLPLLHKIDKESTNVEVWDNNVILQIVLTSTDAIKSTDCYVGLDENNVKKAKLEILDPGLPKVPVKEGERFEGQCATSPNINNDEIASLKDQNTQENNVTVSLAKDDLQSTLEDKRSNDVHLEKLQFQEIELKNNNTDDAPTNEDKHGSIHESRSSFDGMVATQKEAFKSRTMSESHEGDNLTRRYRGILKIGRSLSESSVDDYASWSVNKGEKAKKTVRFSETISKQIFRMNSSILGQRKKNQRKMKSKKRAQERRLSESGNESEGDNEVAFTKNHNSNDKEQDVWFREPDSSSCDVSDVSEVSDVSTESDDGQKEGPKMDTPCSSKKHHKRRGKKSARKNASTAKHQFVEN